MISHSLLILIICKLAFANQEKKVFNNAGGLTPALIFTKENDGIFLVSDKNYASSKIDSQKELLLYTCPPSEKELREFGLNQPIEKNPELRIVESTKKENLQPLQSEVDSSKFASPDEKSDFSLSETAEDDSEDIDSQRIELFLAKEPDIQWRPTVYFCIDYYKPLSNVTSKKCGRMNGDEVETGVLTTVSYTVTYKGNADDPATKRYTKPEVTNYQLKKPFEAELFVYAKCISKKQSLFAFYKVIPFVESPLEIPYEPPHIEYPSINYEQFDPKIYQDDVIDRYYLSYDEQITIFGSLDEKITDMVIPQRLIPTYSITDEYSHGTVASDADLFSLQWLSKAKIWDDLNKVIFDYAKQLKWIIYTGTTGTCKTPTKNPVPIVMKGKSVPLYWWTLIMKVNSGNGRGIVLAMLNEPKHRHRSSHTRKDILCDPDKKCGEYGWEDIITEENKSFVICCPVTGGLTNRLINDFINLEELQLSTQKKGIQAGVMPNRIKVSSLLNVIETIKKKSAKRNSNSATGSPTSAYSSTNTSPDTSADRNEKELQILPKSKSEGTYSTLLRVGAKTLPLISNAYSAISKRRSKASQVSTPAS